MPFRLAPARFVAPLFAAAVVASLVSTANAQSLVRFETTVGNFDMVLNPTNNVLLDEHVDNLLRYVEEGKYNGSWINRAAENFVLQMGGFYTHTKRVSSTIENTRNVTPYDPIEGFPASTITGLSNTVGTVAMALPGGAGGTNQDGGTSSFFVNLTSNAFLDADFTVFAAISDMTTINEIMALTQVDYTQDPNYGAGSGNLAYSDVPLEANGFQVLIRKAYEINDTLAIAKAVSDVQSTMAASMAGSNLSLPEDFSAGAGSLSTTGVPEPTSAVLLLSALAAFATRRRR
jgi:cyclophilin family peptidyl-prolyl cis-trans isomerase